MCLAESNRSTRFCRPLPNRSAKVPNGSLLICECKGRHYYCNHQMFLFLFSYLSYFSTFSCVSSFVRFIFKHPFSYNYCIVRRGK